MQTPTRTMAASAVAFTVLYLVGTFVPTLPEGAYSDARVLGLLEDPGSRSLIVLAGFVFPAAALALLPFLSGLVSTLRRAGGSDTAVGVVWAGGLIYIVMLMLAGLHWGGYALGIAVGELPLPTDATLVRVLSDQGFGLLLVPGLAAAGVMTFTASLVGRRTGALPRWVVTVGFAVAPLMLLGALWVPQFLVPLWVLAAAVGIRGAAQTAREVAAVEGAATWGGGSAEAARGDAARGEAAPARPIGA